MCLSLTLAGGIAAAQTLSLYTGEAPVADQSDEQRAEGLRNAFVQVLGKLSGDPGAANREGVAKAVADAERYVQQYSYRQDVTTEGGQPQVHLSLVAQFDRTAVDRILREAGLKVLGASRPPVLLWLALDDGSGAHLVDDPASPEARAALAAAQARGLNLVLPGISEPAQADLAADAIWRADLPALAANAARRQANLMLVGQLRRVGEQWGARWILVEAGAPQSWDLADGNLESLLAAGANGAADRLAGRYAKASVERHPSTVLVWVDGITSAADYARLLDLLGRDDLVREARPQAARGSGLLLRLNLNVKLAGWIENLPPDGPLRVSEGAEADGAEAVLRFVR